MWKLVASSTLALLVAVGNPVGGAIAQTPQPNAPAAQPSAAAPAPTAGTPEKTAGPRKRKARHASHRKWRRHAGSFKCFGHEWRAFPTRNPNGYFYAPSGGGIC